MIKLIGIFLAIISYVPSSLDAQVLKKSADFPLTRDFGWTKGAEEDDFRDLSYEEYLKQSEDRNHETPYSEYNPTKSHIVKNKEKLGQVETGKGNKTKSGERKSEFGSEDGRPRSKRSVRDFLIRCENSRINSRPQENPATEFSYANTEEWSITNPHCAGRLQSPINIDTRKLIEARFPSNLIWAGYWQRPDVLLMSNTGQTVILESSWNDVTPFITGGPLMGDYQFLQLHFHWGLQDSIGSEHTINNNRFPMELHMVHYKREYGSFENAIEHHDGVVLIAFFFEICDTPNVGLDLLMDGLIWTRNNPGVNVTIQPFSLDLLHGTFERDYITYMGSLPTPPCHEVATWLLSTNPLPISRTQLDKFREISIRWPVKSNSRPTQAVNGRPIYYVEY